MEVYKAISNFPLYSVTEGGDVYSRASNRFLKPTISNGYLGVTLCGVATKKRIPVHLLVADAFIGKRPNGYVINHKNGDKLDNNVANLEWVTQSENVLHAYSNGLRIINQAHKDMAAALGRSRRSFTEAQSMEIRKIYNGKRGDIMRLAREFGLSRYAIRSILDMKS